MSGWGLVKTQNRQDNAYRPQTSCSHFSSLLLPWILLPFCLLKENAKIILLTLGDWLMFSSPTMQIKSKPAHDCASTGL